jgi:hypothetical protein
VKHLPRCLLPLHRVTHWHWSPPKLCGRIEETETTSSDVAILEGDLKVNCNNKVDENMCDLIDISSKPRTALIQGTRDDETMAPQIDHSKYSQLYPNMPADNYLKTSSIRFGSAQFEENMSKGVDQIFTNVGLSSKLSFGSIHMFKKR